MLILSNKWVKQLNEEGETGMGYQIVSILLKSGERYDKVIVLQSACITGIKGMKDIPFTEEDISQIIVTHDKWKFNEENT